MRLAYYTPGTTGSGRVVLGCAIGTALRRRDPAADFVLLTSSPFVHLADMLDIPYCIVEPDPDGVLIGPRPDESALVQAISEIRPDWLITDYAWHRTQPLRSWLPCKVASVMSQTAPERFIVRHAEGELRFDPSVYDRIYTIEPWDPPFDAEDLDPMILRNADELLSREAAAEELDVDAKRQTALIAVNGAPGEFGELKSRYSYLEDAGYQVVTSSNYAGGLFPALDYYNAFDLVVCGAGYSQFWEAVYYQKEAVFVPQPRRFEDQAWRVEACQSYTFTENGADQLARVLLGE